MRQSEWGPIVSKKSGGVAPQVERARQIQKMLNQKMDITDIGEAFGITKNAVYKIVQAYGLRISN